MTINGEPTATTLQEPTDEQPVRIELHGRVGVITMHRPQSRNAINPAMRAAVPASIATLEANDDVDVMVLTGADPAFCAGLDLKIMSDTPERVLGRAERGFDSGSVRPFPDRTKPLIGAINGAAITGGFELALNCDWLVASEHALFADTHARVGVMPGWGLTVLLADAVGRARAREISLTGNFVSAQQALTWGLVNHVVAHEDLLPTVLGLAADIVGNDQVGVRRMLATYADQEAASLDESWAIEGRGAAAFAEVAVPGSDIGNRREQIMERGRRQSGRQSD